MVIVKSTLKIEKNIMPLGSKRHAAAKPGVPSSHAQPQDSPALRNALLTPLLQCPRRPIRTWLRYQDGVFKHSFSQTSDDMLDPLTVLSVTGAIVQFIDFSSKLLTKSHEIYESASGASIDNTQLECIAKDLEGLTARLKTSPSKQSLGTPISKSDPTLLKLVDQCASVAAELLKALSELKVRRTTNTRWESFRKALKSVWKKEEVDNINTRLRNIREELHLHVLVTLR